MQRSIILFALVLFGLLGLMAAKSLLIEPPLQRYHNSPDQFDAQEGKARLASVLGDQRPHPSDTQANDEVRARLIAQLQSIGLKPIVRDQFACNELYKQRGVSCARVRNVIAILGPRTGKALLLNAHYDSSPVGPGAADDGIGVARVLRRRRQPRLQVVLTAQHAKAQQRRHDRRHTLRDSHHHSLTPAHG